MKRVLLLFVAGFMCASAIAQNNNSPVSVLPMQVQTPTVLHKVINPPVVKMNNNHDNSGMRTTSSVTHSDWFDYWNQNETTSSTLYAFVTYPDSNIIDNTAATPYNVYCHGLGVSFDPTDYHYFDSALVPITDPQLGDTQSYSIDSFRVPYWYFHYYSTSGTDSLIVEFFVSSFSTATADSGTYMLEFPASSSYATMTTDLTPRYTSAIYTRTASGLGVNECWDSITAQKQRYAFPLVLSGGSSGILISTLNMALSTPLMVPPGHKVISFVHFKSADSFALGTDATSANYIELFAGTTESTPSTWPLQPPHNTATGYPGSFQTGLLDQNQTRYSASGYTFSGHSIPIPGYAFSAPIVAVPQQAFHVNWTYFPPIAGTMSVCIGSTTTLSDPATGGTWSSGTTSIATVSSSGVVTGVSAGTAVISYTIGSNTQTATVTVLSTPTTPTFTGGSTVCTGQSFLITPSETGGTWSSTATSIATVNSTGNVFGVTAGSAVISYVISNICGTSGGSVSVTVNAAPTVAAITGRDTVCPERTTALADATTGGTWGSSTPSVATISATGVVTGVSNGTDVIWYMKSNTSCSDTAKLNFYVHCTEGVNTVSGSGAEGIALYPNPNEGFFTLLLTSPVDEQVAVKVTNITGQVVKEFTMPTNKTGSVQLVGPSGIYFISATLSGGAYVDKIILIK